MMHRVALLLLIGAVALTVAKTPIEHCCSAGDRAIVQKQWSTLFTNQDSRFHTGLARELLLKLFEVQPEAKALFKNVDVDNPNGPIFTAHCMRIFNAIDMSLNLLGDPESLEEALDHLAHQHQARAGVKKAYVMSFCNVMNRTLFKIIDGFDAMSWRVCFHGILDKISSRLQE